VLVEANFASLRAVVLCCDVPWRVLVAL